MLLPFPSYDALNRDLQDSRISATVYDVAKQLYETSDPPQGIAMVSNYHLRNCLQQAIYQCQQQNGKADHAS